MGGYSFYSDFLLEFKPNEYIFPLFCCWYYAWTLFFWIQINSCNIVDLEWKRDFVLPIKVFPCLIYEFGGFSQWNHPWLLNNLWYYSRGKFEKKLELNCGDRHVCCCKCLRIMHTLCPSVSCLGACCVGLTYMNCLTEWWNGTMFPEAEK